MKSKEHSRINRDELADRLCRIADMVRDGSVRVGDFSTSMPDNLEYELELEEDRHETKLEIEIEWTRAA